MTGLRCWSPADALDLIIQNGDCTYQDRLDPFVPPHSKLINGLPASPIEDIDNTMVASADDEFTIFPETDLSGSPCLVHLDWECPESSTVHPIQTNSLSRIINRKHALSCIQNSVSAV